MLRNGRPPLYVQQDEGRAEAEMSKVLWYSRSLPRVIMRDIWRGQTGRALNGRLRALNFNLWAMGCHAVTCLVGCLQVSSADKVLRTKESYLKSLLFISIKEVLFHLLTGKSGRIILGLL